MTFGLFNRQLTVEDRIALLEREHLQMEQDVNFLIQESRLMLDKLGVSYEELVALSESMAQDSEAFSSFSKVS